MEQVTLSSLTDLQFRENKTVDGKPLIVPKLDYWSAMFSNTNIKCIALWLGILDYLPDFLGKMLLVPTATCMYFAFIFNDIKFFVPSQSLISAGININEKDSINDSVFGIVFEKIKVDLSGEGLIYLRYLWNQKYVGKSVDETLRTLYLNRDYQIGASGEILGNDGAIIQFTGECDLPGSQKGTFHVTRTDVAFDLVNYRQSFLDDVQTYLDLLRADNKPRVRCGGLSGSFVYSTMLGSDKHTVYIGTTQSDNLLRIYDKKKQYQDENQQWKKPCPYGDIKSWIRIEIQLRDKAARKMLYSQNDNLSDWYLAVFHWIYDRYAFLDSSLYNVFNHKFVPESFWVDLFNWPEIISIIQNHYFVELPVDLEKKNDTYVEEIAWTNLVIYSARHGDLRYMLMSKSEKYRELSQSPDLTVSIPATNALRRLTNRMISMLNGRPWSEVFPFATIDSDNIIKLNNI